jgi:hypothetical protein
MMNFLITFLLMLLSGSIFILGFYTITRGKIVTLPNGDEEKEKEIFGEWQLFWEDISLYRKVFYEGKQLEFKLKILEQLKPAYINEITFSTKDRKSLFFSTQPTEAEIRDIEFVLNCHIFKNDTVIFLYDEIPVYRFPEWVRKITNCYVCLSSVGGTFVYWTFLFYYPNIFELSSNPSTAKFIFWIMYCVSLSFINKTIKEFFDSDKK